MERKFRKAKASIGMSNCVEVAEPIRSDPTVAIRDSKLGAGSPVLKFQPAEWSAFTTAVRAGKFNLPA